MDTDDALQMAEGLKAELLQPERITDSEQDRVRPFRFAISNRMTVTFGKCDYRRRLITLSGPLVRANDWSEVRDTILHELAHAMVGPGHGHDATWCAAARRIGARDRARYSGDDVQPAAGHTHEAVCMGCGAVTRTYHRKPPRRRNLYSHRATHCRPGLEAWQRRIVVQAVDQPARPDPAPVAGVIIAGGARRPQPVAARTATRLDSHRDSDTWYDPAAGRMSREGGTVECTGPCGQVQPRTKYPTTSDPQVRATECRACRDARRRG